MCFTFEAEPRRSPASKDINGITATWYDVFTICFQVLPFFRAPLRHSKIYWFKWAAQLCRQVGLRYAQQHNRAKFNLWGDFLKQKRIRMSQIAWDQISVMLAFFEHSIASISNKTRMQGSERLLRTMPIQMNPDV